MLALGVSGARGIGEEGRGGATLEGVGEFLGRKSSELENCSIAS